MGKRIACISATIAICLSGIVLYAGPSVGNPQVSPTAITVNTPTTVTVTSLISDPTLIPTGVNLLRLNANGTSAIIGQLNDSGLNGDVIAGDQIFTDRITLTEAQSGQIKLQVSAAFKGLLRRVLSEIISIDVIDPGCVATLTPTDAAFDFSASSSTIDVSIPAGCSWQATTPATWITFPFGSTGTGRTQLTYSVMANTLPTARTAKITIAGASFQVNQAGKICSYSIYSDDRAFPASGGIGIITIGTTPGCPWEAVSDFSWISITRGASGTGSGQVEFAVRANTTSNGRIGTITVANRPFTVSQAAASLTPSCSVSGTPAIIRRTGLTELVGDLSMSCANLPQSGILMDVLVTFNTTITSRVLPGESEISEALLLLNNPDVPILGGNAFYGEIAGYNSMRFSNVRILPVSGGMASLRLVNLRVSTAQLDSLASVYAALSIQSAISVSVANSQVTVATVIDPIVASVASEQMGFPDLYEVTLTVGESFSNALRYRIGASGTIDYGSESGYTHASLGALIGEASTGTRIRAVYSGIPVGVSVYAPVFPDGTENVQLIGADANGAGGSFLTGTAFGGTHVQLTPVNGTVTASWEVRSADAAAIEEYVFGFVLSGAIAAGMDPDSATMKVSLAPVSSVAVSSASAPIPRFLEVTAVKLINLRRLPY